MRNRCIRSPSSRLRFAHGRVDITPPVGIYHRMWGAARHDRATGIHRPLYGDVLVFEPLDLAGSDQRMIRVQLDHVGFGEERHRALKTVVGQAGGVPLERVVLTYSHTHSAGWYTPDRFELPGGELMLAYLEQLGDKLQKTCRETVGCLQEVVITYEYGWCGMAAERDCWDEEINGYVTGYNPDAATDNQVTVGRVTDANGTIIHSFVHYACHPTTLAWENTLLSPDFVGAMRATVEQQTGGNCSYLQAPSGDIGPRHGHQGDTSVADSNGRQLAWVALAMLESMGPVGHDFRYSGPVISGATLGSWAYEPATEERLAAQGVFRGGRHKVTLPLKSRPDRQSLTAELATWETRQFEADKSGNTIAARDYGARAERTRRWLGRLDGFSNGDIYGMPFSVYRLGDAVWVTCGGEPYNKLQTKLRDRFPLWIIIVSPLDSGIEVAYLLPREQYGKGLYQEESSLLAAGCLEKLLDAITARIEKVITN